jgi:hypothetical protein
LMDATLPVVMRRTWVCPSRLLAAAVNPVMATERDRDRVPAGPDTTSIGPAINSQSFPSNQASNLYLLKRDTP